MVTEPNPESDSIGMAYIVFPPIIQELREKMEDTLNKIDGLKNIEAVAGFFTIILDLLAKMPFELQTDIMNGPFKDIVHSSFVSAGIQINPITIVRKEMN